jgi:aminoglycoside phosphotransferase (APT) family kinase protein
MSSHRHPSFAVALRVLESLTEARGARARDDAVGRMVSLGEGIHYRVFGATCLVEGRDVALVVRVPHRDTGRALTEAAVRERRLLEHLGRLELPIRVPRPVAEVPVSTGLAIVQEWIRGVPCELRAPVSGGRPWETVAEAAAAVHAVDPAPLREFLPDADVRSHARSAIDRLRELRIPEARDAAAWADAHLPPDGPGVLLHGDLLGQNLLLAPDESLGVIDWGMAGLGDPAYDLAIVTRGGRKPFQVEHGLERLLEAYERRAGRTLAPARVHLHELVLCAGFCREEAREHGATSPVATQARAKLRSVLERAVRASR